MKKEEIKSLLEIAVRKFWSMRDSSASAQVASRGQGSQEGNRASVIAGNHLDGFLDLFQAIATNVSPSLRVLRKGTTIPGFFRPSKDWDLLIIDDDNGKKSLMAAIELKSQVGSFGNNFNNRVEEAIGNALDLRTAVREKAYGEAAKPFLGYFFVLQSCEGSLKNTRISSNHFPILPEFTNASYAKRYHIFCGKLVTENLYDAASLLLTKQEKASTGEYESFENETSAEFLINALIHHIQARID